MLEVREDFTKMTFELSLKTRIGELACGRRERETQEWRSGRALRTAERRWSGRGGGCRHSGKAGRARNPSERAGTLEQCGPSVLTPAPSLLIKIVPSILLQQLPNLSPYFQNQLLIITHHNITNAITKLPL